MTGPAREGLARGPEVRSQRATLRRQLATGHVQLADLIEGDASEDVEALALPMTIADLFGAVPHLNVVAVAANGNLTHLNHRLGDLPVAQRRRLAEAIRKDRA